MDSDEAEIEYSPAGSPSLQRRQPTATSSKATPCCSLWDVKSVEVQVTGAEKVQDYIAYAILINGTVEVKRRYSEFESLRKILKKLYPWCVIPPIPEKHSIVMYAKKQSKAKDDPVIIEHRKRMLQSFLRNVLNHPVLGRDHLFHRFLEQGTWADVLFSHHISPSASSMGATAATAASSSTATASTAPNTVVGSGRALDNPDLKFIELEQQNDAFGQHMTQLDKLAKHLCKKYGDMGACFAELGAVLNAFSLHEGGPSAYASTMTLPSSSSPSSSKAMDAGRMLEHAGLAADQTHRSTQSFKQVLDQHWTDAVHEQVQFYHSTVDVLKMRHARHAQYEELGRQLDHKRAQLSALERGSTVSSVSTGPSSSSSSATTTAGLVRFMMGGVEIIQDRVSSMLDSDPVTTRRNQIAKCRDAISQLEKHREEAHVELGRVSERVHEEMGRVRAQRASEVRQLVLELVRVQRGWFRENLEVWEKTWADVGGQDKS